MSMKQMVLTEVTPGNNGNMALPVNILRVACRIFSAETEDVCVTIHDYESGRDFRLTPSDRPAEQQPRRAKMRYSESTTVKTRRVFEQSYTW